MSGKELPPITEEADLLARLREAPSLRLIAPMRDDDSVTGESAALCESELASFPKPTRFLAWVEEFGTAHKLLDHVRDVTCAENVTALQALPLRYGPYCSMWMLPEHPLADWQPAGGA